MRVTVIINPISGGRGADPASERAALAARVMAEAGVTADVRMSERPGHAFDLARAAVDGGSSIVFAWGGDGTMNEVARALAFGPAALALVRAGSGNGLARELGVDGTAGAQLSSALRTPERLIDAGEIDGRLFFNVAGAGLDARVAARFNAQSGNWRGLLPYLVYGTQAVVSRQALTFSFEADGERWTQQALLVTLANSRQFGYGAIIAPRARLDDGLLDLVVIDDRSLSRGARDAQRLFSGTLDHAPGVLMRQVRTVSVSSPGPILFHVDGETQRGGATLRARVHPRALRVRA
jgi:diacylglycerol kinase (ATP)